MTVNTNYNISQQAPFLEEHQQTLLTAAMNLTNEPYTQYGGERVAGFAGDQLDAFDLARQGIGAYQPYINAAGNYVDGAINVAGSTIEQGLDQTMQGTGAVDVSPYTTTGMGYGASGVGAMEQMVPDAANYMGQSAQYGDLGQYMNPFQQHVTDVTMEEMRRQADLDLNQLNARMGQAGSFGGSRHGVAEAEMMRNQEANRARTLAELNLQNFNNAQNVEQALAMRQFQAGQGFGNLGQQRANVYGQAGQLAGQLGQLDSQAQQDYYNRQLRAGQDIANMGVAQGNLGLDASRVLSGIGGLAQQYGQADTALLGQIGGMQQGQRQAELDTLYNTYLEQTMSPYQRLGFYSDMIRGTPSSQSSMTVKSTPEKSSLAQGLGALGQFAGAGQQFGWWGTGED